MFTFQQLMVLLFTHLWCQPGNVKKTKSFSKKDHPLLTAKVPFIDFIHSLIHLFIHQSNIYVPKGISGALRRRFHCNNSAE